MADGRVILADFVRLTDETVEFSTRKKAVVEEPVEESDDSILDTTDDPEEADEPEIAVAELNVPTFSAVAALEEEKNYIAPTPELDGGEEVEKIEEEECVQEL